MQDEDEGTAANGFRRLQSIADGDGSEIRRQFVLAGLLLMIFERFKEYVTNQVDGFFASYVEFKDGRLAYTRGEAFKALIRERGGGNPGQHANKVFRAALNWFHEFNAIDKSTLEEIERLYALRNEIGHELFEIIANDIKKPVTLTDVLMTLGVYVTIVRWWVKEIEATTDPDMTQEKYASANWDEVESVDTLFLRLILQKSLADDPEWEALRAGK
ncbi:MAG: hypothetical protein J0H97_14215 [Alphaproteobacteria bacterium]|jgi:hypothetical protein|nr:hypothetical protein [Alphaproteobacteria bacterium]